MIKLTTLLRLQLFYCIAGIFFNLISWTLITTGYQALTPTLPVQGIIILSIYGLFLLPGYFNQLSWYRLLMTTSIIILGYGGIIKHLISINETPELYNSAYAGFLGIAINAFGFALNLIAALGRFSKR